MTTPLDHYFHRSYGRERISAAYTFPLGAGRELSVAALTERGLVRERNEDTFLLCGPLLAVFDGCGGMKKGHLASLIAAEAVALYGFRHYPARVHQLAASLLERVISPSFPGKSAAAAEVLQKLKQGITRQGYDLREVCVNEDHGIHTLLQTLSTEMGTTIVTAEFSSDQVRYYYQGDSHLLARNLPGREHIYKAGLTADEDTLFAQQQAKNPGEKPSRSLRGMLTAALGGQGNPNRERTVESEQLHLEGLYLLFSDGVDDVQEGNDYTFDKIALFPLEKYGPLNPAQSVSSLADDVVGKALAGGGRDNITFLAARVDKAGAGT